LKTAYDRSNARAETVKDRIDPVEDVSEALFQTSSLSLEKWL
jgi:hypothetical protein